MRQFRQLLVRLGAWWTERRMWFRYITNKKKYSRERMFIRGEHKPLTPKVYEEVLTFVRQTVNISPRPYGKGSYGLKLAAVWDDGNEGIGDDFQADFLYPEREVVYSKLKERMESWESPPDGIMVGVLPYGALAEGL